MGVDISFGESFGNFFGLIRSIFKNDLVDILVLAAIYLLIQALVVGLRIYWLCFITLIPNMFAFKWASDRARGDRSHNIFQTVAAVFTSPNLLSLIGMVLLMTIIFPFTYMFAGAMLYPVFSFIASDNMSFGDAFSHYFRAASFKVYAISFGLLFCAYFVGLFFFSDITMALMGAVVGAELSGAGTQGPITGTTFMANDYTAQPAQPAYNGGYEAPASAEVPAGVVQDVVTPEQPAYV